MNGLARVPQLDSRQIEMLRGLRNGKLLPELLRIFRDQVQRQIAEIQIAVRQRDPQALSAAVHSLKSASFSIGAGRVGQLCAQLEAEARQPAPQISAELCAALEQCVAELLPELEQLLA